MRSKRHSFLTNFLKLTGSFGINLYSLNMKFHEKIFTTIIIIQLWNFGNFGISEIIPKSLVTLRFSKISLHELKISCKTFQMRHWPNFYFLHMKFHEKIFTTIKIIQLWNFGNFGTSEIIPKNLVTLRFLKVSLHELKFSCKTFQLSH